MRKLLEQCPACAGELIVTQQTCTTCHTSVVGQFKPPIFAKLSPESLKFVELFVKNRGNVKDMERELGWSYWTIRNRLNDVIGELGFDNSESPETSEDPEVALSRQRQEVLARLNAGQIDVNKAAELLAQLRSPS